MCTAVSQFCSHLIDLFSQTGIFHSNPTCLPWAVQACSKRHCSIVAAMSWADRRRSARRWSYRGHSASWSASSTAATRSDPRTSGSPAIRSCSMALESVASGCILPSLRVSWRLAHERKFTVPALLRTGERMVPRSSRCVWLGCCTNVETGLGSRPA